MVERRRDPTFHIQNERPLTVRQRKHDLQARVNGDLPLEFSHVALTSYAGLELFGRYLRRTRFNALVRDLFRGTGRWRDKSKLWAMLNRRQTGSLGSAAAKLRAGVNTNRQRAALAAVTCEPTNGTCICIVRAGKR